MAVRYIHTAHVRGHGEFPVDMLRYDACHPSAEADSAAIADVRALRTVHVRKTTDSKFTAFTAARWASFGWELYDVRVERIA